MSGGDDRPSFGRSLDEWRRCHTDGCEWRVLASYWCQDHGGRSPFAEFRYTPTGGYQERAGVPVEYVNPLRAS